MLFVKVESCLQESPYSFNSHMYNLSLSLDHCRIGCYRNSTKMNHLMYEDDLVLNIPNIIKIEGGHVNS